MTECGGFPRKKETEHDEDGEEGNQVALHGLWRELAAAGG